jgi:hypothetical protein
LILEKRLQNLIVSILFTSICEARFVSTGEILEELVKLTPEERRVIARRLAELESGVVDLQSRGIDACEAAELRGRLERFADDWDSPEMAAYDNYDAAKTSL